VKWTVVSVSNGSHLGSLAGYFLQANFEKVYNGCQVKALTEINSWKNTQI
jgi:hypothetical protein